MGNDGEYPISVDAEPDPNLSRWLWLIKWLLVVPHYLVLIPLWFSFVVLTAIAFFAILFKGKYPRRLFDFNVGVLRWTWRVGYYSYGALGTDRYPPFSLGPVDYPASLRVEYPERLSRRLVLVKWWVLAVPHYLIVMLFKGGLGVRYGGLNLLLVLYSALALLATGRYPSDLFQLVLGISRWTYRVAAYAALMRDEYPPFRLGP